MGRIGDWDVESQYDYFGARYYDSRIGRWLAVDTLQAHYPSLNAYAYAANNPINFYDPDGRWVQFVIGAAIGAAVEAGVQLATKGEIESWSKVGVAAAAGALTGGISSLSGTGLRVGLDVAVNVSQGIANNAIDGKPFSPQDAVTDAATGVLGSIAGEATQAALKSTKQEAKVLARAADRTERVAAGDPASSGRRVAAEKAREKYEKYGAARSQAVGDAVTRSSCGGVVGIAGGNAPQSGPRYATTGSQSAPSDKTKVVLNQR